MIDYSSARELAENSEQIPENYMFVEHRGRLYAFHAESRPRSKHRQIIMNELNTEEDETLLDYDLEREDVEIKASVYSPEYDGFREVHGQGLDELAEDVLGI